MRAAPSIYTAEELRSEGWPTTPSIKAMCSDSQGPLKWVPVRPKSLPGVCLFRRLKAAWLVFTGRADVVVFEDH